MFAYNIDEVFMWSNVVSIDKEYDKEIDYILKRLQSTKDVSSAVEESKDRLWVYLASACERQDDVEDDMCDMMQEVFLSFLKLRFFLSKLNICALNHAKCALLCSLVHFDREFENNIVAKAISSSLDYNVDGLLNFRLRALTEGWAEIADVANRLLDNSVGDSDIYDIAGFITGSEGRKSQLVLKGNGIYSLTKRQNINIIKIFDDEEYDLLFAIVREKPCEILLENCSFSAPMLASLKRISRVVEK